MKSSFKPLLCGLVALLSTLIYQPSTFGQGTSFTYDGWLIDGGSPANGVYDLEFRVFDMLTGGSQQGSTVNADDTGVTNGLFTVTLDPGAGVFTGAARWLSIAVRPGASMGAYTNLVPRQSVTATPYAIYAGGASAAGLSGTLPAGALSGPYNGSVNLSNAANSFAGNGSGLTVLNASQLTSGTVPAAALGNAWRIDGNAGTSPGTQFLGTTDNQPLEFKVNGERALRLQPDLNSITPNLIGGWRLNSIDSGIYGAIIAGGGEDSLFNEINNAAHFSVIGGGRGNVAGGKWSTISGGDRNSSSGDAASVGGGRLNSAAGNFSFAAGLRAKANHSGTFVWADSSDADFASTAANQFLIRAAGGVGIGTPPATELDVAGSGWFRGDSGGLSTTAGQGVRVFLDTISTNGNVFAYDYGAGGGSLNLILQQPGGNVGIGTPSPQWPLDVDGSMHVGSYSADGTPKLIRFGDGNYVSIGENNADDRMELTAASFVFNNGSVGIGTTNPTARLDVAGEVTCVAVNITSDRNAKEQFKAVNARDVLAKVVGLPISEWQYKTDGDARHIGPMAQDFRETFALGHDEKHITSVDADGVALAAIQGLHQMVQEKDAELGRLKAENQSLTERLAAIERALGLKNIESASRSATRK